MARWRIGHGALLAVLALPAIAEATMLEHLSTSRLTRSARWVHVGEVSSQWSSWDPQKKMVFTYTKLRVNRTLKGGAVREVLIRQAGGSAGGYGTVVHGVARFTRGERALVFLKEDTDGAPSLAGMAQGKYAILRDSSTGEETAVFDPPSSTEFVTRRGMSRAEWISPRQVARRVPLDQLIREVSRYAASERSMDP